MSADRQPIMVSVNPATEQVLGQFPLATTAEVERALDQARRAFREWRTVPLAARAAGLRRVADHLRANKARLAGLITAEMGKPIVEAEAEIEKCAWGAAYFADDGPALLADVPRPSSAAESYIAFDPLGPLLAIMPWNFPFWQVLRCAAPALLAGNTVILKHASNVPQCALAIEEVFRASDLPSGIFQTLLISAQTATRLIADPRLAAVTLTGSAAAGAAVAAAAGRALKKAVLELGGSDPFIVAADADLEATVPAAVRARNQNSGQSCIAAKRFILVDAIADAFLARFVAATAALATGDPRERTTQIGPLARDDLRQALDRQVRASAALGARVLLGGERLARPGYYYAATILDAVTPAMPAFREETFGPLAAIVRARDVEEAVALANDTPYGLGASLWTGDVTEARRLVRRIEAGNVFVNGVVASDPRLPFGGVKRSGYGRELSEYGLREFTNVKTVWIGPSVSRQPQRGPAE